jgi:hypothetical protein
MFAQTIKSPRFRNKRDAGFLLFCRFCSAFLLGSRLFFVARLGVFDVFVEPIDLLV